ncbi:MAG: leucine--tRNA ligase [Christensenellaceae bacterium]|nr:MAG: leucine--tRNA ligase [Clostridiales bacterium]
MDMKSVERKWQAKWEKSKQNSFNKKNVDKKWYVLEMFSYPSGAKLHVGHWYNYGPTDSYARFKKLQGYEVFQPIGFDAFGLPAENYAIKTGIHPKDSTEKNIATMEQQLHDIGAMFDWSAEVKTCDEEYYRWTQWLFLQLYKKGLAYRKEALVNWCPSCETVLANEQVVDGKCERCGEAVVRKDMTQWFLKITDYAEELLDGLSTLDWPEKTKLMQKNWIGKSTGCEVNFECETGDTVTVFTTRPDTLFGVDYVVLAPEHPLVKKLKEAHPERAADIDAYVAYAAAANDIDRLSTAREKTGTFSGAYVTHPLTGKKLPVYLADYVLYSYGTGAVMAVAAHDERDYAFAKKYNLPVTQVIQKKGGETVLPFCEDGILVNSGEFDGLSGDEARDAIAAYLNKTGKGGKKVNYRLRDWSVSRQRYWGAPIPMIHCEKCGVVPVPEKDLPVKLPYDVEFRPTGKSPLAANEKFMNCTCPNCGGKAKRDPDTLDTFVCSSWYYLRYPDAHNEKQPFSKEIVDKMLPVDVYVGGAEHACMHLLYARFITKALRDMGYLRFDEPFRRLVHQGVILGPDGNRMSKSKGNVVSPDAYVEEYGSDVFRLYLMFGFSYTEGGPWNDDGIKSIARFLDRVERLVKKAAESEDGKSGEKTAAEKELDYAKNYAAKNITRDMEAFSFNTSVARLMEYVNALQKYETAATYDAKFFKACVNDFIVMLAPFTPHFAEELWEMTGHKTSVFDEHYPVADESALVRDETEYAVQINSKIKAKMMIAKNLTNEEIQSAVCADPQIAPLLEGKTVKKCIVVPNRLVNLIVG